MPGMKLWESARKQLKPIKAKKYRHGMSNGRPTFKGADRIIAVGNDLLEQQLSVNSLSSAAELRSKRDKGAKSRTFAENFGRN